MIKDSIKNTVSYLEKYNRPVVNLLQDGLELKSIKQKVNDLNLPFPNDFYELYSIYNGTLAKEGDILDDLHFFPGFYFLSLEDAINCYNAFKDDSRWDKNWFPIFSNGGGDFFCIDCNKNREFQIQGFLLGYTGDFTDYINLASMFKTIEECYKTGAYFIDSEGSLDNDIDKEKEIGKKYNPGLARWD